jgi:hypothetical protein
MSLIGPRPERPEFVRQLEKAVPFYRDRERVLPGVTGLAQVQLPPDTDVSEVRRKLAFDLYYIQKRGLWLDLRVVLCTVAKVIGIPARTSRVLLGLPSVEEIEAHHDRLAAPAQGREGKIAVGLGKAAEGEPALA